MGKGVFVVHSSAADEAHEPVFDEWYSTVHIPEVLAVPGIVSARRFRIVDGGADDHTFLTLYEIDADDVGAPLREVFRRTRAGEMDLPDHVRSGRPPATALYELIGDYDAATSRAGAGDH